MLNQSTGVHERPLARPKRAVAAAPAGMGVDALNLTSPEIVLDLSRLLSRVRFNAPTGVDRVEMAYAEQLMQLAPERLSFAAVHPTGVYGRLPLRAVSRFLSETAEIWANSNRKARDIPWVAKQFTTLANLLPSFAPEPLAPVMRPRVYLQVSPHHLDHPQRVRSILARERARFVCLVHDLIPIEYPEHARPNGLSLHRRRMDTITQYADAIIAASATTRRSFLNYTNAAGREIEVRVSPLGSDLPIPPPEAHVTSAPYFVSIGTIEPRKNHLLLLNLWRRMVEDLGPRATPRLVLVGRRGWENENILDMLDRCQPLKGVVEERGHLSDQEMWSLVKAARAVLMPSFAEGFGLPVIEALSLGVPVVCSDIPAHREIAGPVAEFLDPLDGPAWRRMVLDYSAPGSLRRQEQLRRLGGWQRPAWRSHVEAALTLIDELGR